MSPLMVVSESLAMHESQTPVVQIYFGGIMEAEAAKASNQYLGASYGRIPVRGLLLILRQR